MGEDLEKTTENLTDDEIKERDSDVWTNTYPGSAQVLTNIYLVW